MPSLSIRSRCAQARSLAGANISFGNPDNQAPRPTSRTTRNVPRALKRGSWTAVNQSINQPSPSPRTAPMRGSRTASSMAARCTFTRSGQPPVHHRTGWLYIRTHAPNPQTVDPLAPDAHEDGLHRSGFSFVECVCPLSTAACIEGHGLRRRHGRPSPRSRHHHRKHHGFDQRRRPIHHQPRHGPAARSAGEVHRLH